MTMEGQCGSFAKHDAKSQRFPHEISSEYPYEIISPPGDDDFVPQQVILQQSTPLMDPVQTIPCIGPPGVTEPASIKFDCQTETLSDRNSSFQLSSNKPQHANQPCQPAMDVDANVMEKTMISTLMDFYAEIGQFANANDNETQQKKTESQLEQTDKATNIAMQQIDTVKGCQTLETFTCQEMHLADDVHQASEKKGKCVIETNVALGNSRTCDQKSEKIPSIIQLNGTEGMCSSSSSVLLTQSSSNSGVTMTTAEETPSNIVIEEKTGHSASVKNKVGESYVSGTALTFNAEHLHSGSSCIGSKHNDFFDCLERRQINTDIVYESSVATETSKGVSRITNPKDTGGDTPSGIVRDCELQVFPHDDINTSSESCTSRETSSNVDDSAAGVEPDPHIPLLCSNTSLTIPKSFSTSGDRGSNVSSTLLNNVGINDAILEDRGCLSDSHLVSRKKVCKNSEDRDGESNQHETGKLLLDISRSNKSSNSFSQTVRPAKNDQLRDNMKDPGIVPILIGDSDGRDDPVMDITNFPADCSERKQGSNKIVNESIALVRGSNSRFSVARQSIFSSLESLKSLQNYTTFDKIAEEAISTTIMSLENVLRNAASYGVKHKGQAGRHPFRANLLKDFSEKVDSEGNSLYNAGKNEEKLKASSFNGQSKVYAGTKGDACHRLPSSSFKHRRCSDAHKKVTQENKGLFISFLIELFE